MSTKIVGSEVSVRCAAQCRASPTPGLPDPVEPRIADGGAGGHGCANRALDRRGPGNAVRNLLASFRGLPRKPSGSGNQLEPLHRKRSSSNANACKIPRSRWRSRRRCAANGRRSARSSTGYRASTTCRADGKWKIPSHSCRSSGAAVSTSSTARRGPCPPRDAGDHVARARIPGGVRRGGGAGNRHRDLRGRAHHGFRAGRSHLVAAGREALRYPNWAVQVAVALVGPEAYERHWQPRRGWWLVRRAASLARREAGGGAARRFVRIGIAN